MHYDVEVFAPDSIAADDRSSQGVVLANDTSSQAQWIATCAELVVGSARKYNENLIQNGSTTGSNPLKFGLQDGLEVLGDPPGAKMAQNASQVASGAAFLELLSLILVPRWAKLGSS